MYVINMPSGTDKRDALMLGAFYTGLDLEFVDAVVGVDVPPEAYPQDWPAQEPIGSIGTWRAHVNVYSEMIQERIQTALIMENGADWDEMLKLQMLEIVLGARHVQSSITPKHSAYGDEWEALFIGHCGTNDRINGKLQSVDQRYWVINNDPTVIPPQHRIGNRSPDQRPPAISDADNSTRIPIRLNIEAFMYGKELIQSQYLGETIYDTIDPQSLKLPIGKPARVQGGFQSTADGRSIAGDGGRRSESRRYEGSTRQLMRKLSDQM